MNIPTANTSPAQLDKQYAIADRYLNGYKRRVLGIPLLYADDEAIEMLFRIQQRSPGSQLAERSLLRTADYFFKDKQWDLAADVYGVYMKSYPARPKCPAGETSPGVCESFPVPRQQVRSDIHP